MYDTVPSGFAELKLVSQYREIDTKCISIGLVTTKLTIQSRCITNMTYKEITSPSLSLLITLSFIKSKKIYIHVNQIQIYIYAIYFEELSQY